MFCTGACPTPRRTLVKCEWTASGFCVPVCPSSLGLTHTSTTCSHQRCMLRPVPGLTVHLGTTGSSNLPHKATHDFCLLHLHSTPPLRGFPSNYRHPVWYGKTRMVWLPDGEKISKIDLFVLTWSTKVTDGQTDGQTGGVNQATVKKSVKKKYL